MIPPFRSGCKTDVGTDPRGRWTFGGLVAMLGGVAGAASFGEVNPLFIAFLSSFAAPRSISSAPSIAVRIPCRHRRCPSVPPLLVCKVH